MRNELEIFANFARIYVITSLSLAHKKLCMRCDVNNRNIFQNKVYD